MQRNPAPREDKPQHGKVLADHGNTIAVYDATARVVHLVLAGEAEQYIVGHPGAAGVTHARWAEAAIVASVPGERGRITEQAQELHDALHEHDSE